MIHVLIPTQQKEADSQKDLEREASLKHSLEELEAKNKEITLLEKQVKDLEQKLQLADAKLTERVCLYLFPYSLYIYYYGTKCKHITHKLCMLYACSKVVVKFLGLNCPKILVGNGDVKPY